MLSKQLYNLYCLVPISCYAHFVLIWKDVDPSVDSATAGATRSSGVVVLMLTRQRTHYFLCHLSHLRHGWHIPKTQILLTSRGAHMQFRKFGIYYFVPQVSGKIFFDPHEKPGKE